MKIYLISFFLFIANLTSILAQENKSIVAETITDPLVNKLQKYNNVFPIEKIHLHADKPYYAAGENIWFKTYVTNSQTTNSSILSKIAFIELLNTQGKIVKKVNIQLISGLGWANISLPDTLTSGNYHLRAYTSWMLNFESDFLFEKVIKIGKSIKNPYSIAHQFIENNDLKRYAQVEIRDEMGRPVNHKKINYSFIDINNSNKTYSSQTDESGRLEIKLPDNITVQSFKGININLEEKDLLGISHFIPFLEEEDELDLQFFPEGGELIDGISSKVAFKAVNKNGKGVKINGAIVDQNETEIATFESNDLGMGNFYILPTVNVNYKSKVNYQKKAYQIDLPKIIPSGYALSVNHVNTPLINVRLSITPDLVQQHNISDSLSLILHKNGYPVFMARVSAKKNSSIIQIPKENLESGINTITLFNIHNKAVSERIIFNLKDEDLININIKNLKNVYNTKQEVQIDLIGMVKNLPVRGNYSVAVTHNSLVEPDPDNETHILSSLLINADIKGYIEKPNYYFNHENKYASNHLDDLLLTQGWRKIKWDEVIEERYRPLNYDSQTLIPISGLVTNFYGSPIDNANITMFSPNNLSIMNKTISDKKGRFSFNNNIFPDTTRIIINATRRNKATDLMLKMDSISSINFNRSKFLAAYDTNVNYALKTYIENNEEYFEQLKRKGFLNEVNVLKEVVIRGQYMSKEMASRHSSNLNGAGNADYVIDARKAPPTATVKSLLYRYPTITSLPIYVFVDGMPFTLNPEDIIGSIDAIYPINLIRSIEILRLNGNLTNIYGSNRFGNIIIITTKRGDDDDEIDSKYKNSIALTNLGIASAKEFYSPIRFANDTFSPDLRNTVYWNPNVLSDKEGNFSFSYYNTDMPGIYRVVIEGISENGEIARKVFTYEVK